MQHHFALMRRIAMLEDIKPLPGAQRRLAAAHRNGNRGLGQRGADMGWHVVRPFGGVAIIHVLARQLRKEILQILLHIGIGIFLDQQRRRGVADETGEKPSPIFSSRANFATASVNS